MSVQSTMSPAEEAEWERVTTEGKLVRAVSSPPPVKHTFKCANCRRAGIDPVWQTEDEEALWAHIEEAHNEDDPPSAPATDPLKTRYIEVLIGLVSERTDAAMLDRIERLLFA